MASRASSTAASEGVPAHSDLERKISQAIDEGHDADIPSSEGYVLDEEGEKRRRRSIAQRDGKINAARHSQGSVPRDADEEKGLGTVNEPTTSDETDDPDPNIVTMETTDKEHPYQWPRHITWLNCCLISLMTFLTPLASSIFAPGVPQLMREFGSSDLSIASFVVSVYILGFAFGPLVLAPLSEIYGRVPVYHGCNVGFIAFVIGCALAPSMDVMIAFRFLSGLFGSCVVTNGGGSLADMFPQERRAAAMSAFTVGPLFGPIVGPVVGGFLGDAKGWRWNFWVLAIAAGFLSLVMVFSLRESYVPVLLERKVAKLRKETGNELLRSKFDIGLSPKDFFKRGIVRPLKMLTFSPIVMILSIYIAVAYGYMYVMFTSFTVVFMEYYDFNAKIVGLSFLGIGIGSLLGVAIVSLTSDKYIKKKAAEADASAEASGGVKEGMKPEYRLPGLPYGSLAIPVGFFIYGWTAEYRVHWIVPIFGTMIIGTGNLVIFIQLQMYLIDSFTIYAASALAANTVVRSIAGAVLPLAGLPMYERLGVGWGNSLLAFIALPLVPGGFLVIKYGEYIRKRFPIKNL